MSEKFQNQYAPDYISQPGETLSEILEEHNMSQTELAHQLGKRKKTINEIVNKNAPITSETAIQLERVLGTRASFWINRESQYRQFLARWEEEKEQEEDDTDWP